MLATILSTFMSVVCKGQTINDSQRDVDPSVPVWADIVSASATQNGAYLTFQLQTAAEIPHLVKDSCLFEFVLRPFSWVAPKVGYQAVPTKQVIRFNLSHWDGSPWFAMKTFTYHDTSDTMIDTSKMFDWKLSENKLRVRFSLDGSSWSSVQWSAKVFYANRYVSVFPDTGFASLEVRRDSLVGLSSARGECSVFTFPVSFEPVLKSYSMTLVADEAYRLESALTDILPVCGDSVQYVFNPYYGGAAIEGSPICLGPAMWGKRPLWFVYFHELGHDFCNASARFRQLYPLTVGLPPGPLPFNILFYEAWASLPAMYVYDAFMSDSVSTDVPKDVVVDIRTDWTKIKDRFTAEWDKYKAKPEFRTINPDIVDGLFLQLRDEYGWTFFKRFYGVMRPQTKLLPVFDAHVANDSSDLRITRSTLTAALFSALANKDLSEDFRHWDFPIDSSLFDSVYPNLQHYLLTREELKVK